ncbi:MAG: acetylglutamate kinase [Candidatus Tectimicrobiota bacterium]|nr:MAG: acetylglutamate kinase [Candidatus Tectomicrobia bacterium]
MDLTPYTQRADVLIEALPYIRQFFGKTVVIKYGGHAMIDDALRHAFARDIVLLKYVGMHPIVVHGGGPQIGETMKRMGLTARFVDGLRVTDAATMDVVEMVLGGKLNKEIVATINLHGGQAVGLSGKDANLLVATKKRLYRQETPDAPPTPVDLGQVGDITAVNSTVIEVLEANGFIPVIAPTAVGTQGESYNVNADTAAGDIAAALRAEKLLFLTDVPGILDRDGKLLSSLNTAALEALKAEGVLDGGMLPKVEACLHALRHGVAKAHIIDGRVPHAVLLELFTDRGIGTEIVR